MRQPLRHGPTSILHNPVALGGVAAIAVALVVAVAVILTAGGDDGSKSANIAPPAKTPAAAQAQSDDLDGLTGKATSTINVRSGPGNGYSALGVLRRGADVRIVGQSDDAEWLQIEYPSRSNLHGWVVVSSLEVQGDLAAVPIGTPDAMPLADVPTYEAEATPPPLFTPEIMETAAATPTSTPAADLPDLAVGGFLVSGGGLVVTVTNQGTGALTETAIEVAVLNVAETQTLNVTTSAVQTLAAGASIDVRTGYVPFGGPPKVLVIVDPNGKIAETDDTNNRLVVTLSSDSTPAATEAPNP